MKKERGIITLLTDFGTADGYVAAMKGVILSINPDATIIDISHQIPPQDITAGAFVLSQSAPFFPRGTVHIAVVDPGVGGKRKPILIETDKYFFVGPDNGIFSIVLQNERIRRKINLTNKDYFLGYISSTFHGRDIFSPVGAYLSLGIDPSIFGKKIKTIKELGFKRPYARNGKITGQIIHIDRFGNLITNIDKDLLERVFRKRPFAINIGGVIIKLFVPSYAHAKEGETVGLIGSSNLLEIAKRNADAGQELGAKKGDEVEIRLRDKAF